MKQKQTNQSPMQFVCIVDAPLVKTKQRDLYLLRVLERLVHTRKNIALTLITNISPIPLWVQKNNRMLVQPVERTHPSFLAATIGVTIKKHVDYLLVSSPHTFFFLWMWAKLLGIQSIYIPNKRRQKRSHQTRIQTILCRWHAHWHEWNTNQYDLVLRLLHRNSHKQLTAVAEQLYLSIYMHCVLKTNTPRFSSPSFTS